PAAALVPAPYKSPFATSGSENRLHPDKHPVRSTQKTFFARLGCITPPPAAAPWRLGGRRKARTRHGLNPSKARDVSLAVGSPRNDARIGQCLDGCVAHDHLSTRQRARGITLVVEDVQGQPGQRRRGWDAQPTSVTRALAEDATERKGGAPPKEALVLG